MRPIVLEAKLFTVKSYVGDHTPTKVYLGDHDSAVVVVSLFDFRPSEIGHVGIQKSQNTKTSPTHFTPCQSDTKWQSWDPHPRVSSSSTSTLSQTISRDVNMVDP